MNMSKELSLFRCNGIYYEYILDFLSRYNYLEDKPELVKYIFQQVKK